MASGHSQIKALQAWCKEVTQNYKDVDVKDMSRSWKDGLAFCAIIHHFRPDLIDFSCLSKENVAENNRLAFETAEKELGIPQLLDPEDMVEILVPDRLCIVTYVSQYYNYFSRHPRGAPAPPMKSPHKFAVFSHKNLGKKALDKKPVVTTTKRPFSATQENKSDEPSKTIADSLTSPPSSAKRPSLSDICQACNKKVYLLERHIVEGILYHRTCFRCRRCNATLKPGGFYSPASEAFECTKHQHEPEQQTSEPAQTNKPTTGNALLRDRLQEVDLSKFSSPPAYRSQSDTPDILNSYLSTESTVPASQNAHGPQKAVLSENIKQEEVGSAEGKVDGDVSVAAEETKSDKHEERKSVLSAVKSIESKINVKKPLGEKPPLQPRPLSLQRVGEGKGVKPPLTPRPLSLQKVEAGSDPSFPVISFEKKPFVFEKKDGEKRSPVTEKAVSDLDPKTVSPVTPQRERNLSVISEQDSEEMEVDEAKDSKSEHQQIDFTKKPSVPDAIQLLINKPTGHKIRPLIIPSFRKFERTKPSMTELTEEVEAEDDTIANEIQTNGAVHSRSETNSKLANSDFSECVAARVSKSSPTVHESCKNGPSLSLDVQSSESVSINDDLSDKNKLKNVLHKAAAAKLDKEKVGSSVFYDESEKTCVPSEPKYSTELLVKANETKSTSVFYDNEQTGATQESAHKTTVAEIKKSVFYDSCQNSEGRVNSSLSSTSEVPSTKSKTAEDSESQPSTVGAIIDQNHSVPSQDIQTLSDLKSQVHEQGDSVPAEKSAVSVEKSAAALLPLQSSVDVVVKPQAPTPKKRHAPPVPPPITSRTKISETVSPVPPPRHSTGVTPPLPKPRQSLNPFADDMSDEDLETDSSSEPASLVQTPEQKPKLEEAKSEPAESSKLNSVRKKIVPLNPFEESDDDIFDDSGIKVELEKTEAEANSQVSASLNPFGDSEDEFHTADENEILSNNTTPKKKPAPKPPIRHSVTGASLQRLKENTHAPVSNESSKTASPKVRKKTPPRRPLTSPPPRPKATSNGLPTERKDDNHLSSSEELIPPPKPPRSPHLSREPDQIVIAGDTAQTKNIQKPKVPPPPPPMKKISAEQLSPLSSPDIKRAVVKKGKDVDSVSRTIKRPAPKPPVYRRKIVKDRQNKEHIRLELLQLDMQQTELERKGADIEEKLRGLDESKDLSLDTSTSASLDLENEDHLLAEWFELVNTKNLLVRRENELVYVQRQEELEERHEEVEYQLRCLMEKPESKREESDKETEEQLLAELVHIVEQRNMIIQNIEQDRVREEEEDRCIGEMMIKQGYAKDDHGTLVKKDKKKKKKKDKKKKKSK